MIDRATIDKIMDATNIVEVVGDFVTLRKAGVNYKGLCPFHDDKTPSFMVSPTKGICHCFACGKGGNAVNFLMEHEQITYPDALRWLAKKYNIEIQERELTDEEKREQNDRESMFIVNEWAKDYFHTILNNDADGTAIGRQYFRSRGIRDDIIEKFCLGFALSKRDALSNEALRKGYKEEFLVKTGLCYKRESDGSLVDRYAGRVIFPWFNISGRVVAFGGRLLDSRTKGVQQKYVNSPDSEIYHKERELYGLFHAKRAIAKEDCVYMVEGYTDVIAMHQCGIENVVANSGTALSYHQIRLLHRFTQNIVLLYDGDEAGIKAAMRGTDMLLEEGMNIKTLLLPDGEDPDSFARKHTAEELRNYIEHNKTDFIEFKTQLMLKGVTDPIKRSEAVSSILKSVAVIPDQIVRETYLRECSIRLGMSEQTLIDSVNKFIRSNREEKEKENRRENRSEESVQDSVKVDIGFHSVSEQNDQVERMLVQCIIRDGEKTVLKGIETADGQLIDLNVAQYIDYDFAADDLQFSNPLYNRILAETLEHCGEEGFQAQPYFANHHDVEISKLASQLIVNRYHLSASMQIKEREGQLLSRVRHLISDLRMDILNSRMKDVKRELQNAGNDMARVMPLLGKLNEIKQLRDQLATELGNDLGN